MSADYCSFCNQRIHWHNAAGEDNEDAKVVMFPDQGLLYVCDECVDKPLLVDRETGEETTFRIVYA